MRFFWQGPPGLSTPMPPPAAAHGWTKRQWEEAATLARTAAWAAAEEAVHAATDEDRIDASDRAIAWSNAAREAILAANPQYAR
jgi:hypothetical protein